MYKPIELARFALSEFERGLEGLTDEEARTRIEKPDGTEMNAVSWTMGHIAHHWLGVSSYATENELDMAGMRFFGPSADPTPLTLSDAASLLAQAQASIDWIDSPDDALLSGRREDHVASMGGQETVGTALMRVTLHTWFHTGEVNAVRQMLGHLEIEYVGQIAGSLEWRSEREA